MGTDLRRLVSPAACLFSLILACSCLPARAERQLPPALQNVGIDDKLGATIPRDLTFVDEAGQPVRLDSFFNNEKPVILTLVYYECPMLCTLVLNGLTAGLQGLPWTPGKEFQIVTISFNPNETPALAKAKKAMYIQEFGRPAATDGWHFMTGKDDQIKPLAAALGFKYAWDPEQKQFAHAAAIFVLSPTGKLTRVLYGLDYPARDLRLALTEAAQGKVGSIVDKVLLFCYHYNPGKKGYTLAAFRVMQLAGVLTAVFLFGVIGSFLWFERRQRRRAVPVSPASQEALRQPQEPPSAAQEQAPPDPSIKS